MTTDFAANDRLTNRKHWDDVYAGTNHERTGAPSHFAIKANRGFAGFKRHCKQLLGPRIVASTANYDDYLLWQVILPRYFEGRQGEKILEIGSAPGSFIIQFKERFGLIPYGIEYSPVGAEMNRRLFLERGVDPENVIEDDFSKVAIQNRYRGTFDVVVSRGFIEHFRDAQNIVRMHLNLLRPGGLLIISIPNLRGVTLALASVFCRELVAMHNLDIMTLKNFSALFPKDEVQKLFCDYYGTFSFYLFTARPDSWMRVPLVACMKAQPVLNSLFRFLLKGRGAESAWFSPNLLFVGVKR